MSDYNGGGGFGQPGRGPVPRRGQDKEFDDYFSTNFGADLGPDADVAEMRRAAWATWRVEAPTTASGGSSRREQEDDELARALALSRDEYQHVAFAAAGGGAGSDSDDELQRAIALSEEEARAPKRPKRDETPEEERRQLELLATSTSTPDPIVTAGLTSVPLEATSSDDVIDRANAEFQKQREADREAQRRARESRNATPSTTTAPSGAATPPVPKAAETVKTTVTSSSNGIPSRAQMEAERLARQAARAPTTSSPGPSSSATASATATAGALAGPSSLAQPQRASSALTRSAHPMRSTIFPADDAGEYYPEGELRHSGLTIGDPTSDPTFSPEQVIGRQSQISLIILSSFVIDDEWLSTVIPSPDRCPTIMVRPHPKDQPTWNGKVQAQPTGEVFCYPRMIGEWGSAHMKYFWIFYKTGRVRVVICTANCVPYDWDWIENVGPRADDAADLSIFVQDFLPHTPAPLREGHLPHDLPLQFRHLFAHTKVHKALKYLVDNHPNGAQIPFSPADGFAALEGYDWSRVKVRLVLSIPGTYDGWDEMDKWGMCRLGAVLREERWRAGKGEKTVTEYQYGFEWFEQFYQFCCGKSPRELRDRPKPKEWAPMKVLYPSLETVKRSQLGVEGGGTMFVGKAWMPTTRKLFHHSRSKRGGVLMHAKLITTTFEPQERALGFEPASASASASASGSGSAGKRKADAMDEGPGGWIYVGSHNFSSAAWGTINLKKQPPTLNIRNYELGIVFPLHEYEKVVDVAARGSARAAADAVVPYRRPAEAYGPADVPWDQKLHAPAST